MERKLILLCLILVSGCNDALITRDGSDEVVSLSSITNTSTIENEPKDISFSMSHSSTNLCSSTYLSAASTNTDVIPLENVTFSGTSSSCIATITPDLNKLGTSIISIIITYKAAKISESFSLTVSPPSPLFVPDSSFGTNSLYSFTKTDFCYTAETKLDLIGNLFYLFGTCTATGPKYARGFLKKITPTGMPDTTFNSTGEVVQDFGGAEDYPGRVYVEDTGKITTSYGSANLSGFYLIQMARVNANGTPDITFGGDGYIDSNLCGNYCWPSDFKKISNKYYVLARAASSENVILLRLLDDGSVDPNMTIRNFDPDPALHRLASVSLQFDGTHLYSFSQTDSSYETANMEDFVICKFDLDGNSVTAFGGTGCLVINGSNNVRRSSGRIILSDSSIYLTGFKNNIPFVTKLDKMTAATDTSFGTAGELSLPEVKKIVGSHLHPTLGLVLVSLFDDLGKDTFSFDVFKQTDGSRWPQNRLKTRYVGEVDPTIGYLPEALAVSGNTLFVSGYLNIAPYTMVTQKLKLQE